VSKSKTLLEELEYIYFTFVDSMDFKDITLTLLNEFTTSAYSFHVTLPFLFFYYYYVFFFFFFFFFLISLSILHSSNMC
jgi:hypothetical protein